MKLKVIGSNMTELNIYIFVALCNVLGGLR